MLIEIRAEINGKVYDLNSPEELEMLKVIALQRIQIIALSKVKKRRGPYSLTDEERQRRRRRLSAISKE